jgi:hypothetical protein
MVRLQTKGRETFDQEVVLSLEFSEILSEVTIDEYIFKVGLHPLLDGRCVLWFRDKRTNSDFEALGHFAKFDKRNVLFFISRYATSARLRSEIGLRRFEQRASGLTREFFIDIERKSMKNKDDAFRCLFNLDEEIDPDALALRRRIMAQKFHPDMGGDHQTMTLINQAYEHLSERVAKNQGC